MKKVYTTVTSIYNGTVTLRNSVATFLSRDLAEEACKRVELVNKDAFMKVRCKIYESDLYEDREEVAILNKSVEELQANVTTKEEWLERKMISKPHVEEFLYTMDDQQTKSDANNN